MWHSRSTIQIFSGRVTIYTFSDIALGMRRKCHMFAVIIGHTVAAVAARATQYAKELTKQISCYTNE